MTIIIYAMIPLATAINGLESNAHIEYVGKSLNQSDPFKSLADKVDSLADSLKSLAGKMGSWRDEIDCKMGSLNDEMRYIKVRQVIERTRERNHIANDAQKVLMRC